VGTFRLSRLAESDLIGISNYGLSTWGAKRAIDYIDSLESCCQRLADNPEPGRLCEHIRPRLRRMEHAQHVIFYRIDSGDILISRILHRRMLPERQVIDDEKFGEPIE
jgi:toxin ParE1/3/4